MSSENETPPPGSGSRRQITLTQSADGELWVARDEQSGVASQGATRQAALDNLDEALALHQSDDSVETWEDERAVLEDLGIDPDEVAAAREDSDELPEFMR